MRKFSIIGLCVCCIGIQASASVVYEGFEYPFSDPIEGQGTDTNGWDGAWASTTTDSRAPYAVASGLTFDNALPPAEGSAQRLTRYGLAQMDRQITTAAQTTLTADDTTLWFSVLMNPGDGIGNGGGYALNTYGTLVLGNSALEASAGVPSIAGSGSAIGVGFAGTPSGDDFNDMRIQGVTYNNGVSTANTNNMITTGNTTAMIVGKVEWAANGSSDTVSLYNIIDPEDDLPAPFSVMIADLDQSTFDVVSIAAAQTSIFDEIRFDTTLAGVIGGEVLPPDPIEIGDISYQIIADSIVLSWYGEPGQLYELGIKDDLTAVTWDTVTNVVGADATITVADEMDQTNAFYQVTSPE